ncbi:hypothetical protein D3C87_1564600 [compost metagenome]
MTVLPVIAATSSSPQSTHSFIAPVAHIAPAMNSSESPGRNGSTTRPVSAKTMANRMPYTQTP